MKKKIDIYKGFKGYNAYPLTEAEKMIRCRIADEFSELVEMVDGCVEKSKRMRLVKILEHILAVKKRVERMKKEIKDRDNLFVPVYLKARIAHLDEEKLKDVDFRLMELIEMNKEIIESLTCAEGDIHIIDKFTRVNENLREMENKCHARALLLKKEVF